MALPETFKICRLADYHTPYLGRYANGKQFMGAVGFARTLSNPMRLQDWRYCAVLHHFDQQGRHLALDVVFVAKFLEAEESLQRGENLYQQAPARLVEMLAHLKEVEFCDIEIRWFEIHMDGYFFGMIDESDAEEGYERVGLMPANLTLFPPWDGTFVHGC